MNVVFFTIVIVAFMAAAYQQIGWVPPTVDALSPMRVLSDGVVEAASGAVSLAIGLVGMMALFLGLVKVAEAGGILKIIAKTLRPLTIRLFPDVPPNHPAMGAMILNFSANALGLANAATPFGIRAIQELDKLNPHKGTATNSMVLFLAITTSNLALLPSGAIAVRVAAGSMDPAGILPTTLFATCISTTVAIIAAKMYQRWSPIASDATSLVQPEPSRETPTPARDAAEVSLEIEAADESYPTWVSALALTGVAMLIPLGVLYGRAISPWAIPGLMVFFLSFGAARKVRVYEMLVEGAREGFQVAIRIIPYLVAILVAVGMLRSSGALGAIVGMLSPFTSLVGLPADALPIALMRPLSGTGALGVHVSTINDPAIGPDSYTGYLVSTLSGSTDTTFYILAVYFGAVQVRRIRHALAAGLTADFAAVMGAVIACSYLYGGLR